MIRGANTIQGKIGAGLFVAALIGLRVWRVIAAPKANASPVDDSTHVAVQAGKPVAVATAEVPKGDTTQIRLGANATAFLAKGQAALEKCDTAAATYAFGQAAGVGIEMMHTDSLAGDPLYYQGVALAGLHDSSSANVLMTEAQRLDKARKVADNPAHTVLLRHVVALARRKCPA
jgi:hypothetical protein